MAEITGFDRTHFSDKGAGGMGFDLDATDFVKALGHLSYDLEHQLGSKAVRAGANMYAKQMRKAVPMDTEDEGGRKRRETRMKWKKAGKGQWFDSKVEDKDTRDVHLRRSIRVRQQKGAKKRGILNFRVGIIGWARAYAHVFEFGSSKGHRANRIFTRTLEANWSQYVEEMTKVMREGLKQHGRS